MENKFKSCRMCDSFGVECFIRDNPEARGICFVSGAKSRIYKQYEMEEGINC